MHTRRLRTVVCFSVLIGGCFDEAVPDTHLLSLAVDGAGQVHTDLGAIECDSDCSVFLGDKRVVTLWATPGNGQQFVQWQGADGCVDAGYICTLTMTADVTATAVFSDCPTPEQAAAAEEPASQPVTDVATIAGEQIDDLVLDAAHFYVRSADATSAQYLSVARADGTQTSRVKAATGKLSGPTEIDATFLYYTLVNDAGTDIIALPLDGSDPVTIATAQTPVTAIALDDSTVYWTTSGAADDAPPAGRIASAPIAGGDTTTIVSGLDHPTSLLQLAGTLYWLAGSTEGSVQSAPIAGGAVTLIASAQPWPSGLVSDGLSLYWVNADTVDPPGLTVPFTPPNGALMQSSLSGGGATALVSSLPQAAGLVHRNGALYWTETSTNASDVFPSSPATTSRINKLRIGSCGPQVLTTRDREVGALAVATDALYWTENTATDGKIVSTAP